MAKSVDEMSVAELRAEANKLATSPDGTVSEDLSKQLFGEDETPAPIDKFAFEIEEGGESEPSKETDTQQKTPVVQKTEEDTSKENTNKDNQVQIPITDE